MKKTTFTGIFLILFLGTGLFAEWTELQKIIASDGAAQDYFGKSVSISGDYAVIGAYEDNDESGSAYIFKKNGTNWIELANLISTNITTGEYFGISVSISGDYILIGAPNDDDNGSAYIFHRDGTNWIEQIRLTASDGSTNDNFGISVSISGDYSVIGAGNDDDNGSAYIFHREGDTWIEQAKITSSDSAPEDYFGESVSISGDYALIGAFRDDDNGNDSGSAYIFQRNGTNWIEQTKLVASDGALDDYFGRSVSISGDYVLIGAYGDDDNGSSSGSAYIFHFDGKTVAYTDAASTSGYIYPSALLIKKGIEPDKYFFAGGHPQAVLAVYGGKADVGCVFWTPINEEEAHDARSMVIGTYPDVMEKIKIIGYTDWIPNATVTFRKDFPLEMKEKIINALLEFANDDKDHEVLKELLEIDNFIRASDEDYDSVREALKTIGEDDF